MTGDVPAGWLCSWSTCMSPLDGHDPSKSSRPQPQSSRPKPPPGEPAFFNGATSAAPLLIGFLMSLVLLVAFQVLVR